MTKSEQSSAPQPAPADKVREQTKFVNGVRCCCLCKGEESCGCECHSPIREAFDAWGGWRGPEPIWDSYRAGWLASRNQTIKRVREAIEKRLRDCIDSRYEVSDNKFAFEDRADELKHLLAELDRELGAGEVEKL